MLGKRSNKPKQMLDAEKCAEILRNAPRGVLAFNGEEGYPYAIPLNFFYDEPQNTIYFHCATEGYKLDCLRVSNKVCFVVCDEGYVICRTSTGQDEMRMNSVVVQGHIDVIDSPDEIARLIRVFDVKWENAEEIEAHIEREGLDMYILILHIEEVSGKLVVEG